MYDNQNNDIQMVANSPSPKRTSTARRNKAKMNESPTSSPLKQPRCPTAYQGFNPQYKPPSKDQILGKPVEIIPGKSKRQELFFGGDMFGAKVTIMVED